MEEVFALNFDRIIVLILVILPLSCLFGVVPLLPQSLPPPSRGPLQTLSTFVEVLVVHHVLDGV